MAHESSNITGLVEARVEEKGHGQKVGEFLDGLDAHVEQVLLQLKEEIGDQAEELMGDQLKQVKSYTQSRREVLDPEARIDTGAASEKGAAAYVNMGSKEMSVDGSALAVDADEAYWERVTEHEQTHQKQAATFNQSGIALNEGEVVDPDTLAEWDATQANEQSDLTSEYRQHQKDGNEVVRAIGSGGREKLMVALRSGDLQSIQKDINAKREEEVEALAA